MIFEWIGDVTLRECIAAALGFSFGLVVMAVSGFAIDALYPATPVREDDLYAWPFADSDPALGRSGKERNEP